MITLDLFWCIYWDFGLLYSTSEPVCTFVYSINQYCPPYKRKRLSDSLHTNCMQTMKTKLDTKNFPSRSVQNILIKMISYVHSTTSIWCSDCVTVHGINCFWNTCTYFFTLFLLQIIHLLRRLMWIHVSWCTNLTYAHPD